MKKLLNTLFFGMYICYKRTGAKNIASLTSETLSWVLMANVVILWDIFVNYLNLEGKLLLDAIVLIPIGLIIFNVNDFLFLRNNRYLSLFSEGHTQKCETKCVLVFIYAVLSIATAIILTVLTRNKVLGLM